MFISEESARGAEEEAAGTWSREEGAVASAGALWVWGKGVYV